MADTEKESTSISNLEYDAKYNTHWYHDTIPFIIISNHQINDTTHTVS